MGTVSDIAVFAALLTTGLMAGVYLALTISVLPGIARTEDATFVVVCTASFATWAMALLS